MEPLTFAVLAVVLAAVVVAPLAREYGDLRRTCGLGRKAALGTLGLVFPAFAAGIALAAPLGERPALQWVTAVAAALLLYSLAARAIVARASAVATAPSRRI